MLLRARAGAAAGAVLPSRHSSYHPPLGIALSIFPIMPSWWDELLKVILGEENRVVESLLQDVVYSCFQGWLPQRELLSLCDLTGSVSLLQSQWQNFMWVIPFFQYSS